MEKPNHSNGKETQSYDPETGKYLSDGGSAGKAEGESSPSLSQEELEMYGDEDRKIASAMSKIIDSPVDRMTFLSMLRRMPQDAQDAYADVILGHNKIQPVNFAVMKTDEDDSSYYSPKTHTIVLSEHPFKMCGGARMEYGIYHPFMTLFHELAHAVDFTIKKVSAGNSERMLSCNQNLKIGSAGNNSLAENALDDIAMSGGDDAFASLLAKKVAERISSRIPEDAKEMTYVEANAITLSESGALCAMFEALSISAGGDRYVDIDNPAEKIVTHCPRLLKDTLKSLAMGHDESYYGGDGLNAAEKKQINGSAEMFATMMSLMATVPDGYKEVATIMPRTAARLRQMLAANVKIRRNRDEYQKELERREQARRGNG